MRNLLGFKYRVIAGYPGGSDMNIAMQRGEVDGRGTFTWTSLKPHYKEWVESGQFVILYQQGLRKHPDLEKVPLVTDLTDDAEYQEAARSPVHRLRTWAGRISSPTACPPTAWPCCAPRSIRS